MKLIDADEFSKHIKALKDVLFTSENVLDAIDAQKTIEIAFECDKKGCHGDVGCFSNECNHTLDIKHAINFENFGGKYMEHRRKRG